VIKQNVLIIFILVLTIGCNDYKSDQFVIGIEEFLGTTSITIQSPIECDMLIVISLSGEIVESWREFNTNNIKHIILDLIPNNQYNVNVNFLLNEKTLNTSNLSFVKNDNNTKLSVLDSSFLEYDDDIYFLLRPFNLSSFVLLNNKGLTTWSLSQGVGDMRGFSLTEDSTIVYIADSTVIREVSFKGKKINEVSLKSILNYKFTLHHDIKKYGNSYYALVENKVFFDFEGLSFKDEGFIELDSKGALKRYFSISKGNSLYNYSENSTDFSGHANSIDVDKNGDVYMSLRNLNQIWKIGIDNEILWTIGYNATNHPLALDESFFGQHSIELISTDKFYIYNNAVFKKLNNAKINMITISNDVIQIDNLIQLPSKFSTVRMGSVGFKNNTFTVSAFNRGFHIIGYENENLKYHYKLNNLSKSIKVFPLSGDYIRQVLNNKYTYKYL